MPELRVFEPKVATRLLWSTTLLFVHCIARATDVAGDIREWATGPARFTTAAPGVVEREISMLPMGAHPPTEAVWLFDEPVGAPLRAPLEDWSHHGYDLTLEAGGRLAPGKFGNALDLLDTGSRAALRRNIDRSGLNLGDFDWTWETWVRMKARAHPGAVLFEMRQGPFELGPVCGLRVGEGPGELVFTCKAAGFAPQKIKSDAGLLRAENTEAWRHIALTYQAEGRQLTHWVDGKEADSIRLPGPLKAFEFNGENNLTIGTDIGGWYPLPALFDEMRFSRAVRYREAFTPPGSFAPVRDRLKLGAGPHLFIDDSLIAAQKNLARVTHQPERRAEPVIPQRKIRDGWEQQAGGATFMYDERAKKFRGWMSVKNQGLEDSEFYASTYWESEDGIEWTAPSLKLFEVGGTLEHNITMTGGRSNMRFHSDSILDDGPSVDDPARRYKMAYFPFDWSREAINGLNVAFSPDGIHWTPYAGNPVMPHWSIEKRHPDAPTTIADINDVYHDRELGLYIQTYKTNASIYEHPLAPENITERWREINDPVPGYRRITGLATSRDFIHWENLQRVMVPDGADTPELQYYAMSIWKRGDLYVGHVRCLDDQAEADGIGWMELATSRDLYHWTRHRDVFLDRNPDPESWDHSICWNGRPAVVGDQFYYHYIGLGAGHKTGTRSIGLAIGRRDGYVSRRAGGEEAGELETITMDLPIKHGTTLTLNATAREGGWIKVGVLDAEGREVAGYAIEQCRAVEGDGLRLAVSWAEHADLSEFAGKGIRLRFALKDAEVYGFELMGAGTSAGE